MFVIRIIITITIAIPEPSGGYFPRNAFPWHKMTVNVPSHSKQKGYQACDPVYDVSILNFNEIVKLRYNSSLPNSLLLPIIIIIHVILTLKPNYFAFRLVNPHQKQEVVFYGQEVQ